MLQIAEGKVEPLADLRKSTKQVRLTQKARGRMNQHAAERLRAGGKQGAA